jgi:hypothetical protein
MRFLYGLPAVEEYEIAAPQILQYDLKKIQIYGLIIATFVVAPLAYLFWRSTWSSAQILAIWDKDQFFLFLGIIFATTVLHEFCHLVAHPGMGTQSSSIFGLDPRSGLPYTTYIRAMPRNRFLIVALTPLIVLSGVSYVAAFFFPEWVSHLAMISIYNAGAALGDVYISYLVLQTVRPQQFIQREQYGELRTLSLPR